MFTTVINLSGANFTHNGFTYFPTAEELKLVNLTEDRLNRYYPVLSVDRQAPTKVSYTALSENLLKERAYIEGEVIFVYRDEYTASLLKSYINERFSSTVAYAKRGELCGL
jgi:hypothetical protein